MNYGDFELVLTVRGNNYVRPLRRGEVEVRQDDETRIYKLCGDRRRAWAKLKAAHEEYRGSLYKLNGSLRARRLVVEWIP